METVTFQHLDTVNLHTSRDVLLFGRTLEGKSVCVQITDVRPHFCIQLPAGVDPEAWFLEFKTNVWVYHLSCIALKDDVEKKTVPHVELKKGSVPSDFLTYEVLDGQDIKQYNEDGPVRFMRIYSESKWTMNKAKRFLSSKEELKYVYSQTYEMDEQHIAKKMLKKRVLDKTLYVEKDGTKCAVSLKTTTLTFDNRIMYTIYNDQVNFTLQYLIDKDIYSCSFIKVTGMVVKDTMDTSKLSFCDYEVRSVDSIEQVDVADMAPWRILSYDIESVPGEHPTKPGKFTFPTPWKDPVCTIGATLQIGTSITLHVWILNGLSGFADRTSLDTLAPLKDPPDEYRPESTQVYAFDSELKMLSDFFDFIRREDIDFLEGHNINRFDNTYMLDRYCVLMNHANMYGKTIEELKVARPEETKPFIGRLKTCRSEITSQTFSSNQKGSHEKFKLLFPGRIVLDLYDIMKDQHNEMSYKLDDLAEKYLGTKKIAQDYNEISPMFKSLKGRHDLAVYCVKDSWLVRRMMDKLCKLTVLLQMSNVTGISMKDVIERGQGIRTMGLMLRYCKKRTPEYLVPRFEVKRRTSKVNMFQKKRKGNQLEMHESVVYADGETYEGAAVIDPVVGFYTDAVSCLDFASLYPSIMRALNMSYETMVPKETVSVMEWRQLTDLSDAPGVRTIPDYEYTNGRLEWRINTDNPTFVTRKVRRGLLPEMLEAVLSERKKVKRMMKALQDKDGTMYKVYDGRQLGLKVVANSIYGFTGANVGFLPEKRIAASVTKYGKFMLYQTKNAVENHEVWGKRGCKVIYGDTDSVFVHIPRCLVDGKTEDELMNAAHEFGTKMAEEITSIFLYPNDLEYEKSYSSFLLLKKKRYAGHKFEPGHGAKLQIKGLEAARRDYAPLLVETQKKMLNILLLDRDITKACDYVGRVVYDLMNGQIPIEKLIMSKKLSRNPRDYKVVAAHVHLALRLAIEMPQVAPVSGDRVDYVIYNSGLQKVSESACLPSEIESGKFSVDVAYYLDKQLRGPLMRILEKVVQNSSDLFNCDTVFKQSVKTSSMSKFVTASRDAASESSSQYRPKRMKVLKAPTETKQQTIMRLFGGKGV